MNETHENKLDDALQVAVQGDQKILLAVKNLWKECSKKNLPVDRIKELLMSGNSVGKKDLVSPNIEELHVYEAEALIAEAVNIYANDPDSCKKIANVQAKFLIQLEWLWLLKNNNKQAFKGFTYQSESGRYSCTEFRNRIQLLNGKPVLFFADDDSKSDYDPPYIRGAQTKQAYYKEIFGFETSIENDSSGGQYYIVLDSILDALRQYVGIKQASRLREKILNLCLQEKKKVEAAKQKEAIEDAKRRMGDEELIEYCIENEDEYQLLQKVLLADRGLVLNKTNVRRFNKLLLVTKSWFTDEITSRTVTSYTNRQAIILDFEKGKVFESPKESKLFRTTEQGVLDDAFDESLKDYGFENSSVIVTYEDDSRVSIQLQGEGKMFFTVSEEIEKSIQAKVQQLLKERLDATHFKIPNVLGGERDSQVLLSGFDYVDPQTALVTISEEIDYRPGYSHPQDHSGYLVQSRILKYNITTNSVELLESKTTPYE